MVDTIRASSIIKMAVGWLLASDLCGSLLAAATLQI